MTGKSTTSLDPNSTPRVMFDVSGTGQGPYVPFSVPGGVPAYQLLNNVGIVNGAAVAGVVRGQHIWTGVGTWGGATMKLQCLGPDGTTWLDVASLTANGSVLVLIGEGSTMRAIVVGGTPSGLYCSLSPA